MADESYKILGDAIAAEAVGEGWLDTIPLATSAATELINRGVSTYQQQQAAEKAKRETEAQVIKVKAADAALAAAEANRDLAGQSNDQARIAATDALLGIAARNAAAASVGLSPDAVTKRIDAANAAAARAADEALAAPGDAVKAAKMRAWQKVAIAAASSAPPAASDLIKHGGGGSGIMRFLERRYGGWPVWGWGLGGLGALTGVALLVKALRK